MSIPFSLVIFRSFQNCLCYTHFSLITSFLTFNILDVLAAFLQKSISVQITDYIKKMYFVTFFRRGIARPGRDADHSPHLVRRSLMSRSYYNLSLLRLHRRVVGLLYLLLCDFENITDLDLHFLQSEIN
jgi:hypothetical protein